MGFTFFDKKSGWDELFSAFEEAEDAVVRVGFLRSEAHQGSDMTVAKIAAIHEFGTDTMPERSFMRSAIDGNKGKIQKTIDTLASKVIDGKMPQKQALGLIGEMIKGLMKQRITAQGPGVKGAWQDISQATKDRKGSSKILIDTGQMINSISWEIVPGKGQAE